MVSGRLKLYLNPKGVSYALFFTTPFIHTRLCALLSKKLPTPKLTFCPKTPVKPAAKSTTDFMILLGVTHTDTEADAKYIADKTANLRIFEDENGKLNLSLKDVGGSILLVSQFTLYADARSGRRPSFSNAAPAEQADKLYQYTAQLLREHGLTVETGRFQTHMQVSLCNDGPVTLLLDSQKTF